MEKATLPKVRDVWIAPKKGSRRYKLVHQLAPQPQAVVFYPTLPRIGMRVWALWRDGCHGFAEYCGGWTYKAGDTEFVNEMPVAWSPAPLPNPQ